MNKDIKYLKATIEGAKLFSTCDKRQYMAMIIDNYGYKIGEGYNGGPKGMPHCSDGACPRLQENSSARGYDNCIAIHAEANALLHSDYTARRGGGTLYVNGTPCFSCAKLVANSGIKRLVFIKETDADHRGWTDTHSFLLTARIEIDYYTEYEVTELAGF